MEIKGIVFQVGQPEQGVSNAGKQWKKQSFVIETQEQYPKRICLDVFNDKVQVPFIGQTVKCQVEIESREYNGRWFTNVSCWKIDNESMPNQRPPQANPQQPQESYDNVHQGSSDLPF